MQNILAICFIYTSVARVHRVCLDVASGMRMEERLHSLVGMAPTFDTADNKSLAAIHSKTYSAI